MYADWHKDLGPSSELLKHWNKGGIAFADFRERYLAEMQDKTKEVQKLASAAQALSARPWFISRTGFTPEAEVYAQQEGIMYSSRGEIEALARVEGELVY